MATSSSSNLLLRSSTPLCHLLRRNLLAPTTLLNPPKQEPVPKQSPFFQFSEQQEPVPKQSPVFPLGFSAPTENWSLNMLCREKGSEKKPVHEDSSADEDDFEDDAEDEDDEDVSEWDEGTTDVSGVETSDSD